MSFWGETKPSSNTATRALSEETCFVVPKTALLLKMRVEFQKKHGGRTYIFMGWRSGLSVEVIGNVGGVEEHGVFEIEKSFSKDRLEDVMEYHRKFILRYGRLDMSKFKLGEWEVTKPEKPVEKFQFTRSRCGQTLASRPRPNLFPTREAQIQAASKRDLTLANRAAQIARLQPSPLHVIKDAKSLRKALIVERHGMCDSKFRSESYDLVVAGLRSYERRFPVEVASARGFLIREELEQAKKLEKSKKKGNKVPPHVQRAYSMIVRELTEKK